MLGLRPQQDENLQPNGLVRPSKHVHMVDENGQSLLSGDQLSSKTPFGSKMPGRKALGNITNKQFQGTPLPAKTPTGGASTTTHGSRMPLHKVPSLVLQANPNTSAGELWGTSQTPLQHCGRRSP